MLKRNLEKKVVKVQPHLQWRPQDIGNTKMMADLPKTVAGVE